LRGNNKYNIYSEYYYCERPNCEGGHAGVLGVVEQRENGLWYAGPKNTPGGSGYGFRERWIATATYLTDYKIRADIDEVSYLRQHSGFVTK